jgi:hypothetical protein
MFFRAEIARAPARQFPEKWGFQVVQPLWVAPLAANIAREIRAALAAEVPAQTLQRTTKFASLSAALSLRRDFDFSH